MSKNSKNSKKEEDKKIVCSYHSSLYDESEPIEVIDDGGMCINCQKNAEAKAERGQLQ